MELARTALSRIGMALVVLALALFAVGLVVFLGGDEGALLPMMGALGVFTAGMGSLAAARAI